MKMSNQTYDKIKLTALLIVPFLAFIASVVNNLDVPYSQQITSCLTALDTLIGAWVAILKAQYDKDDDGQVD